MSLNVKYRPKTLDELLGNEAVKEALTPKLKDMEKRSFFFSGLPGTGKTTLGRIIRDTLGIGEIDYYEYNAANTRGIDTVRQIEQTMWLSPMEGKFKMFLLDEFHQVTNPAQEALLKMLEEPPEHAIFCLCTSEPEKIKKTTYAAIKRRCFRATLQPLKRKDLTDLLKGVAKKERRRFEPAVYKTIIKRSSGSAGTALGLLDTVLSIKDTTTAIKAIEDVTMAEEQVISICKELLSNNTDIVKWRNISKTLKSLAGEPESNRYAILGYLNAVFLNHDGLPVSIANMLMIFSESVMYSGKAGLSMQCFFACIEEHKGEDDIPF